MITSLFFAHLWARVTAHPLEETLRAGRAAPGPSALNSQFRGCTASALPNPSPEAGERGTQNGFPSPLCMCKHLAQNTPAVSWPGTASASSWWDSKALGEDYLSYTTFLQLRTTVIPDTVAMVAWTIDTNLKPRERKGVTPNFAPEGPRSRGGGLGAVAPGELLALGRLLRAHPESLVTARSCGPVPRRRGTRLGWLRQALSPGDTAGGCCQLSSLPLPWLSR